MNIKREFLAALMAGDKEKANDLNKTIKNLDKPYHSLQIIQQNGRFWVDGKELDRDDNAFIFIDGSC